MQCNAKAGDGSVVKCLDRGMRDLMITSHSLSLIVFHAQGRAYLHGTCSLTFTLSCTHARSPQRLRHCFSGSQLEFGRADGCKTVRHQRSNQEGSGTHTSAFWDDHILYWLTHKLLCTVADAAGAWDIDDARVKPQKYCSISRHWPHRWQSQVSTWLGERQPNTQP